MSESRPSKVVMADNSDPEMQRAYANARATFRYFWREAAWERRRIIPALDLMCVKAPFSDGPGKRGREPKVEHMWVGEVDFDGAAVSGSLLNAPNDLTSVRQGDAVRVPLAKISDWMYVIAGEVFGGFTVQLLRSRMGRKERADHDAAWGLTFGDPARVRLAPEPGEGGGVLKNWFGNPQADLDEHPMSEAMAGSLKDQLRKDPSLRTAADDRGWTLLHQEALAGSAPTVKVLLKAGADPAARTDDGKTPADLARALGWEKVEAMLVKAARGG